LIDLQKAVRNNKRKRSMKRKNRNNNQHLTLKDRKIKRQKGKEAKRDYVCRERSFDC